MPPCLTAMPSLNGNTMRLFKNLFSHDHNIICSETIGVIGLPMQTLFIVVIMYHVQFISTNSIFEKDERSCTVQL